MKTFIKNRKGQKISVLVEEVENQKGLVFIMHGLGGFKEQPHIQTFADVFKENSYTTVRFDAANTIGESEGNFENATATNHYEDLEDVIKWAKTQDWYQEPFCLAGHSLGGLCAALYAARHPNEVKALAPISTSISGKMFLEAFSEKEECDRTGWWTRKSTSKPDVVLKLNWNNFVDDLLKYDLLEVAHKLTMPVLLVVGENDHGTPPEHQRQLLDRISGPKELHIIKGASHTFRKENDFRAYNKENLKEIKKILDNWIKKL